MSLFLKEQKMFLKMRNRQEFDKDLVFRKKEFFITALKKIGGQEAVLQIKCRPGRLEDLTQRFFMNSLK